MIKKIIRLIILCATTSTAFVPKMSSLEFSEFKHKYDKRYSSLTDEYVSSKIFTKNAEYIKRRNNEQSSFVLGINHFADKSFDSLRQKVLCRNHLKIQGSLLLHGMPDDRIMTNHTSIDWYSDGFVRQVKDQGMCGSCWAFSTVGALESMVHINTLTPYELSEQELVDCSKRNHGCRGGWMHTAMDYVIANKGIYVAEDYKYTGESGACRKKDPIMRRVSEAGMFRYVFVRPDSPSSLQQALRVNPVCVAVKADMDFMFYKDGVFDSAVEDEPDVNHAVLLTAHDRNRNTWTIKNSWGMDWGRQGFMDIAIRDGSGVAGIHSYCVLPIFDPVSERP